MSTTHDVIRRMRRLDALSTASVIVVPGALMDAVDIDGFLAELRLRITDGGPGPLLIVTDNPDEIRTLDEDAMRAAGWVRAT